jgi:predicted TIM-barrel fold metal-dependent hydrolase
MARSNKSLGEAGPISPISFHPCSNGEFCPSPKAALDHQAERLFWRLVEDHHRKAGLSRRAFAQGYAGYAAARLVINQLYGCGASKGGLGGSAGASGNTAGTGGFYDVTPEMVTDPEKACESLSGREFVMDVQVHPASPLTPWRDAPLPSTAEDFLRTLFVGSDTTVACLSGVPDTRNLGVDNVQANDTLQELVDKLGKQRLIYHANLDPALGASELDHMALLASQYPLAAWKVYPHVGPWRLDDQTAGQPFLDQARALGVKVVAAHRGIANDSGDYSAPSSPDDLVKAAAQHPDLSFLTYHSGWQANVDEEHPFDPNDANPFGVDRLIKAAVDLGVGPNSNVYAELGSTWRQLMTRPAAAAHVLGKLLKHLGEDQIVWGTDAVFTGSPQEQIVAFRAFQIPESMQEMYGYPALTPTAKAKILGLNGARVYGIEVDAMRCAIKNDFVERLKLAHLDDPASVPIPSEREYGPRSRREFLDMLRWERG